MLIASWERLKDWVPFSRLKIKLYSSYKSREIQNSGKIIPHERSNLPEWNKSLDVVSYGFFNVYFIFLNCWWSAAKRKCFWSKKKNKSMNFWLFIMFGFHSKVMKSMLRLGGLLLWSIVRMVKPDVCVLFFGKNIVQTHLQCCSWRRCSF